MRTLDVTYVGNRDNNIDGDFAIVRSVELISNFIISGVEIDRDKRRSHMGRKRKNRGNTVGHQLHRVEDPLTIKSSWFGDNIKWVSRHDANRNDSSLMKRNSASNNEDEILGKSATSDPNNDHDLSISGQGNKTSSSGINAKDIIDVPATYQSLIFELNQLKQQLMPAAQSCADAINNCNDNNRKATTPQHEFRQARSICNPFENLGDLSIRPHRYNNSKRRRRKGSKSSSFLFVNRSAIKLANIDALLGFVLTTPSRSNTKTTTLPGTDTSLKVDDSKYFAFVDLCGAPGGFSEYILYRHMNPLHNADSHSAAGADIGDCDNDTISCFGFGMSLSGRNDEGKGVRWDLNHLREHFQLQSNDDLAANKDDNTTTQTSAFNTSEQVLHYYVCRGVDGTGTIYNWENVAELQRQISMYLPREGHGSDAKNGNDTESTEQHQRVHLVVADGGFDAQRDSDNQEVLAHHIVVSQTAAALTLLRKGGIFIVKMFGFHEESTKRMLRYLYGCFYKMTFVKPISSRPASAERYLVCYGYDGVGSDWDGLAWKQQQMELKPVEAENTAHDCTPLDNLATQFDLDMLKLNVENCRSIVDYLHKKRAAAE